MKTLSILTVLMVLVFSLAIAEEQMTGTKLVEPITKVEVLKLELQVLEAQAQSKTNELNIYLTQLKFLQLKIPAVQGEIRELNAQILKKVSEISKTEEPQEIPVP